MVKVFIDPGHGGNDPGAVANGLQEKNITLQIATSIRDILLSEYDNVSISMSRNGDQTVSLNARTNAANNWGADFYLSVHINSGGGTGFESFVYPGVGRATITYQETIHQKILEHVEWNNRGRKQSNFHVLRETSMDALLTESGFIDNSSDASQLRDPNFIQNLARGHAEGIAAAFNLPRKQGIQSKQPSAPPVGNGSLFRVQIGAYRDKNNAEQAANSAKDSGFQTYIKQVDDLFKVQIGAFKDRKNAEDLLNRAKAAGLNAAIVIE